MDGVVAQGRQGLAFRGAEVNEACVQRVQTAVRQRVLGLFEWRGLLSSETVGVMQGWGHSGGFSVHVGVRVAAEALLAPVRYWLMRGVRYFTPAAAAPPTYVSWGDEQAAFAPC